ncbi:MAG: isocitrate/isopropylmalate dehydrogenase family protein [Paracoccaceae bacterium]|nr:isocitrate/isopropylmalate dehydrogenase family protein [Paracoccaceae bacterium]
MTRLLILEGDGIGPEIVAATRRVIEAADRAHGLGLTLETAEIGFAALAAQGTTCPDEVIARARAADGVVMGPVSHNDYPPVSEGGINPSARLRIGLDLFANIRPARTPAGVAARRPMDLIIVRENTEGFYADRNMAQGLGEMMVTADVGIALRRITRPACRRIAETAFALAGARPRRRVTAVHKANVLRMTDGLFLEETRRSAAAHPDIDYQEVLVDAMAAHLVRDPDRHDVIVTTNMFGDILSDLATELAGGLGLASSLNAGETRAMAQAQHGSAPDIAGRGIANPASLIASVAMLFDWLADRQGPAFRLAAAGIRRGLDAATADPAVRTPDLGGSGTTEGMGRYVAAAVGDCGTRPGNAEAEDVT